ncbi:hypothetical protein SARC_00404 [Sphaeroforma arctica JP610]|uniref:C2 domain-containing protein n=1 Tax=Sphaeroforma arctica JP610 TaxID=667725 RepID=A0A0L0GF13_9EUKA|nr:hypothetical protein SARC_00404 [Sphaeroforma arctica JP610]KNC87469.1 hypothetical protein SARC_00404 [Sphaeroforma arctica JP610]|eukprot:XP_014161371.1 hypothetical protein SARC_00404 [Sphaeroforma arctica JP610]
MFFPQTPTNFKLISGIILAQAPSCLIPVHTLTSMLALVGWLVAVHRYVLKPPSMLTPGSQFDPDDYTTFGHDRYGGIKPVKITIEILAGKHLNTLKGTPTPFVEIDVVGTDIDSEQKYRTSGKTSAGVQSNGLCPHWEMEVFQMTILYPDLALIRLSVMDEGVFGEPQAFAHACVPVRCLRAGLRSIPLVNGLGEPLEMSALLVRCELEPHQLVLEEKVGVLVQL